MTDVTIKTLPKLRNRSRRVARRSASTMTRAAAPMAAAMGSSCDVSGAAHLPAHVARRFRGPAIRRGGDGVPPRRRRRRRSSTARTSLAALLKPFGAVEVIAETAIARALARHPRRGAFAATGDGHDRPLWRVSTAPGKGFELSAMISPGAQMFYDWGGGLIWIAMPPSDDAGAAGSAASRRDARRPRDAGPRAGRDPRRGRRVPAAGRRGRRVDQAGEGQLRSEGHSQSRADVGGRLECKPISPSRSSPIRTSRNPTRSCAPACIAASAPRPARPMCCSATSSIPRAGAST